MGVPSSHAWDATHASLAGPLLDEKDAKRLPGVAPTHRVQDLNHKALGTKSRPPLALEALRHGGQGDIRTPHMAAGERGADYTPAVGGVTHDPLRPAVVDLFVRVFPFRSTNEIGGLMSKSC